MSDALARACAEKMWVGDAASQSLGMVLEAIGPGHAVLSMEVAAHMVNGHQVCHGGMIFMLADSAMGFASNTHNQVSLAQHCTVTYLRPARLGEILRAEAVERVREGRSGMYDVRVIGADGGVIAEFRGHVRTTGEKFFPEAS